MTKSAATATAKQTAKPTAYINARLIDPETERDEPGGVVVREGLIEDIGKHLRRNAPDGMEIIDCGGHILCPGLIDAQVFTGEPGSEHRETLMTASQAAAAGGVTSIIVMPDTDPVIDQVSLVDFIQRRARDNAVVRVHTMAATTRGLKGEEMTEIGLLKRAGAIAFSNGKSSIANTRVMRNVLNYAKDHNAVIVHHTEDPYLSQNAAMNSGEVAARLGLTGVSRSAETIVLERDVRLVEMTGGRYHAATISCAESLAVVQNAKTNKLPVTCGVSINHLTLNENDIGSYRTFFKIRPPLRSEDDRQAMVQAIASGDIDIIVSSHDPQDTDDKRRPFSEAADGAIGLETLLSGVLRLHHTDGIALTTILKALTINPARIFGLSTGRLSKGAPADLIIFDPDEPWVVNKDFLRARSKNTPFDEAKLQGRVKQTLVAGVSVYRYPDTANT
ncbi:MAG: dihydroorotase [Alphaproteobacteria bacterium]|nr:dihydroorotase [Alphaproteobacteria bacterium]